MIALKVMLRNELKCLKKVNLLDLKIMRGKSSHHL